MELIELLKTLTAAFGPSGNEGEAADVIEKLAKPYVDETSRDALGNLICHRRGSGPKVMFAAHMDSVGLVVTHVEQDGLLRVGKLGAVRPASILHAPVRFRNGVRGAICCNADAEPDKLKLEDLYIDIGAATEQEARAHADVGDAAAYDLPLRDLGGEFMGPYLDDRAGCAALLLALEKLEKSDNDLYFVFTAQEEVGTRGAAVAAFAIEPDYAVAMDVTIADDLPGSKHMGTTRQGRGAGIKLMDRSMVSQPALVQRLKSLAAERDIPFQLDVSGRGGTDAGAIQRSGAGVCSGVLSIPSRYTHSPLEMVDKRDVLACADLVRAFAEAGLERP